MISWAAARILLIAMVAFAGVELNPSNAAAATDGPYQDVYWVNGCASGGGVFSPSWYGSMGTGPYCPSELEIYAPPPAAAKGENAKWSTITPSPSIRIIGVTDTGVADCNLHHDGFTAGYFWGDNGVNYGGPQVTIDCHGAVNRNDYAGSLSQKIQSSRYFGWSASCNQLSCTPTGAGVIVFSVLAITLEAQETSGPALTADQSSNLYYQSGWVRGAFPADLSASDPSGVCSMQTVVNGRALSSYADPSPDSTSWTQCHGGEIDASVDTTAYANGAGAIKLTYAAANAAGAPSTATKAINVDNVTPQVSLSAPADTASTAGTQVVMATATAGPSGIAAISCSVDGGPLQTYKGATAQIPVVGIGSHTVACSARNNATNVSGVPATSPLTTLNLAIRQPTASAITFARIADALRCHTATEVVKVAGRMHTVRRHGRRVRVRGPAHRVRRKVRKCHARTVVRTVRVVLMRHGKPVLRHGKPVYAKRRVRRVLLPHVVDQPTRRVGHGKATPVNGLLELTDGTALPNRAVEILAAPSNGLSQFVPMATVTTNAYGEWSARVPPGPSRLIEAVYPGDGTTEPATSSTVTLTVPAKLGISITPRVLPWHATLTIRGHLEGGYVPPGGVALRLLVRYTGAPQATVLLAFRTNARGQFKIRWAYPSGHGVASYPMWVSTTAAETDYAFAPSRSRHLRVTFGRPTPRRRHHGHRRHHQHRRPATARANSGAMSP
jgi:hypothetical protein